MPKYNYEFMPFSIIRKFSNIFNRLKMADNLHDMPKLERQNIYPQEVPTIGQMGRGRNAKKEDLNKELEANEFNGQGYKCLSAAQASSKRFKGFHFIGEFLILNVEYPSGLYPEEPLKAIFNSILEKLSEGASQMGIKPNHFIIKIDSFLMDHSVTLHIRDFNEDAASACMHKFREIDQSGENKGKDSLVTQSFLIDSSAFDSPPPPQKPPTTRKRRFPGRGKKKGLDYVIDYQINEKALYKCTNDDSYCLFYALELLRNRHLLTRQRFHEYVRDEIRQQEDVMALLEWTGIPNDLEDYDITDYGQRIQQFYDEKWPGQFQLYAFEQYGNYKPFWKSEPIGRNKFALCVLYEEMHYIPVKNIAKLFSNSSLYCFACEQPFSRAARHKTNCEHRCKGCRRHGRQFPCQPDGECHFCFQCDKGFSSKQCFRHHLKVKICENYKRCRDCARHYQVRWTKPKNGEGRNRIPHKCDENFCKRCFSFHGPRGCFIRPVEIGDDKAKRIIVFDFESISAIKPEQGIMSFKHEVNFAFAHVFCTNCLADGTWNSPLETPCEICLDKRRFSWAPFKYEGTNVDEHNECANPLAEFTKWTLNHFKKKARAIPVDEMDATIEAVASGQIGGDEQPRVIRKSKEVETLLYSHFGGRYDNVLVLGEMIRLARTDPKVIRQGNKLFQMSIKSSKQTAPLRFLDSFNIIPVKLANFPETFALNMEGKHYFPYNYNQPENYGVTLPHLPDPEDYNADGLLRKAREKFDRWYEANRNSPFNLCNELASYCSSGLLERNRLGDKVGNLDVEILLHGLVKMDQLFRKVTGMSIFGAVTISSASMKYFRTLLKENHLALVPHLGYCGQDKQSKKARQFLKWLAYKNKWDIQDCTSLEKEKRYRQYLLDGYVKRAGEEKDLAIEIMGCFWHACPECYNKLTDEDSLGGRRVGNIRCDNATKCEEILEEMDLLVFWEHEIDELYEKDLEYQAFVDNLVDEGPINIRDAFFGGRTGPDLLISAPNEVKIPNELDGKPVDMNKEFPTENAEYHLNRMLKRRIKMWDFISLYPTENFTLEYPAAHPKLVIVDKRVNWNSSADLYESIDDEGNNLVRSIAKVFMVPPRHIDVTVVPHRLKDGRLLFPLCRACSIKYPNGERKPDYFCQHFDDDRRGFTATLPHMELAEALDAGYRVTKVFRAYVWQQKDMDENLFKDYVRKFLRIKYISSGWPAPIKAMSGTQQIRAMREYCDKANEEFGLSIRPADIEENSGMKFIAKLLLNCLWGRFALRNRLSQTVIVSNDADLAMYLNDEKIDISYIDQITERAMMVVYQTKDEFIMENPSSNLIIALFTTSSARVRLLKTLQKLMKRCDVRVLYKDTDSVAYEYTEMFGDPIEGGMHLGELSDVYPEWEIVEAIFAAPKVYSLKLMHKVTGEIRYEQKLKGVTLDMHNSEIFNHEELKRRTRNKINGVVDKPMELDNTKFRLTRAGDIHTIDSKKKFDIVLNKGILLADGSLVPFGYSGSIRDERNAGYYERFGYDPRMEKMKEILEHRYHPDRPFDHIFYNDNHPISRQTLKSIYHD